MLLVKEIYKSYRLGKRRTYALRKASFSLPEKGMVAIYGKSGSGKTTLLNLLSGLDRPTGGKIYYRGQLLTERNLALYRGIEATLVFQHYNLIQKATAQANVALPLEMVGLSKSSAYRKASFLLDKVGLAHKKKQVVDTLSGGEKQRTAIARSLVNDPSVVFCDEPTGALDEKNAVQVMELLQRLSRDRLVVFVTHNQEFVERFGQYRLGLEGGRIKECVLPSAKMKTGTMKKAKRSSMWAGSFTKRNLWRNRLKNLLCGFSGVLGFASLLLTLGFYAGSKVALEAEENKSLLYQTAYLSEEEKVPIPNSPLTLVKQRKPPIETALDLLEGIEGLTYERDLSFFLPSVLPYEFAGQMRDPVSFAPVYDLSLKEGGFDLLVDGTPGSRYGWNEVLVNGEFASKYPKVVGKQIHFIAKSQLQRGDGSEEVILDETLTIAGVVSEFSFLNEPRIYYSYLGLQQRLSEIELSHFNKVGRTKYTVMDFLDECPEDSPYLQYRYLVFAHRRDQVKALHSRIEELTDGPYSLEAETYRIGQAFSGLMDAFASSLAILAVMAMVGLAAILALMAYSSYITRRKECAVLLSLGARRSELGLVYGGEASLVCLFAVSFALALAHPLSTLANRFLSSRFGMEGIIAIPWSEPLGFPFALALVLVLESVAFGFVFGVLPILLSKAIPVAEVLRDE